jgi:hypothetical protein
MVRGEQRATVGRGVLRAMLELEFNASNRYAAPLKIVQIGVKPDSSQSHYHLQILQSFQLAVEKCGALRQLLAQRLIVGRSAARRGGNIQILQCKAVVTPGCGRVIGEAGLVQYRIHEVSRRIAGERSPGAVGAMSARRETHN